MARNSGVLVTHRVPAFSGVNRSLVPLMCPWEGSTVSSKTCGDLEVVSRCPPGRRLPGTMSP